MKQWAIDVVQSIVIQIFVTQPIIDSMRLSAKLIMGRIALYVTMSSSSVHSYSMQHQSVSACVVSVY